MSGGSPKFQVGQKAGSGHQPVPSRGNPTLLCVGEVQHWRARGKISYITPVVYGVTNPSNERRKLAMAYKRLDWLHNNCRLGRQECLKATDKVGTRLQIGGLATYHLPSWGSPTIESKQQDQQWHTNGRLGYITTATWGVPNTSHRGEKKHEPTSGHIGCITPVLWGVANALKRGTHSSMAHKWVDWLHSCLPSGGSPTLQSGEQSH